MEVILEIFLELILQIVMEFCADAGLRVRTPKNEPERPPHVIWSIVSYGTFGAGVGLFTLLIWVSFSLSNKILNEKIEMNIYKS